MSNEDGVIQVRDGDILFVGVGDNIDDATADAYRRFLRDAGIPDSVYVVYMSSTAGVQVVRYVPPEPERPLYRTTADGDVLRHEPMSEHSALDCDDEMHWIKVTDEQLIRDRLRYYPRA